MRTRIITDSTNDLTPEFMSRVDIIPLTLSFGDEEYTDGVNITKAEFYNKLIENDVLPVTSQATPAVFAVRFAEIAAAGDEAVVITISSRLSGTYQSAQVAAADYEGIYVVDSGSVTIGGGILVELAVSYMDQGLSAKEIAEKLEEDKKRIVIVALIDTLEYLKKGGRISKTASIAGAILNIKPVLSIVDGVIEILGKARGSKQGNNLLVEEIGRAGGVDFSMPVLLGYTGITDVLLKKYIEDSRHIWENGLENIRYTCVGSVVGTHAGPGAVAVAFFSKSGVKNQ